MNKLVSKVTVLLAALLLWLPPAIAQSPSPQEGQWTARDFRFSSGESIPELRIHYRTLGSPHAEPVLILHGTTQSGAAMLAPAFGGELFGPGQPLDANKYFLILPDAIGHGLSSKPSDGMRTSFPRYNYDDMVSASVRLLTEHLGIRRLRLVLGYSMGGMQAWILAGKHPQMADVVVPLASIPAEMSGRNWMLRRLIIDSIRRDPAWQNGNYTQQPSSVRFASVFYGLATLGGNQGLQRLAPTREKADALVDQRLNAPFTADANDTLYQWEASRDYNPSAHLERIEAFVLAINSADDERNPPELGLLEREMKRVKHGQIHIIPASENTAGHGTAYFARHWAKQLAELLEAAPKRPR